MALADDFWRQVDLRIRAVLDEWAVQKLGGLIRGGKLSGGTIGGTIPMASVPAHASTHENTGSDELSAANLTSGAATAGQVLTADGAGGATWV